jgi:hypothetical protein
MVSIDFRGGLGATWKTNKGVNPSKPLGRHLEKSMEGIEKFLGEPRK